MKNPCMNRNIFYTVEDLGIRSVGDLFMNDIFASFRQLQDQYSLHTSTFFKYLQVRYYVKNHIPSVVEAKPARLDDLLGLGGAVSHLISLLYNSLLSRAYPLQKI